MTKLIGKGGGIFPRQSKEIQLSPEACWGGKSVMSGEVLIHHILKMKVDLLWNGGIGFHQGNR